jgi:hypothetical protein
MYVHVSSSVMSTEVIMDGDPGMYGSALVYLYTDF